MEQVDKIIFLKKLSILLLCTILMFFLLIGCDSKKKETEPVMLCSTFYRLNKYNDFKGLFNISILGNRERSEFNESILKYNRIPVIIEINNSVSKKNIIIPSFSRNADASEKELFFTRCNSSCITYLKKKYKVNSNDSLFWLYVKEINSIYSEYYQIKVPDELPYTNIPIIGSGNYIEFVLYKDEKKKIKYSCYYVKDTSFSNIRLKEYFSTLPKFDKNWYYSISWH